MNCISEVHRIRGLTPRRARGLNRPTRDIPGLGLIEYVREERCHGWQFSHQFVPSRRTLVDQVLREDEEPSKAVEFVAALVRHERPIRERVIRARYFEFANPEARQPAFDEILMRLDDWAAPYRVNRWGDSVTLWYDCFDAPQTRLIGAAQIGVSVDADFSISDVNYFTRGLAEELKIAAYRQRIPPEGFLVDSIADQFITMRSVRPTAELADLLTQSIEQTADLIERSSGPGEAFLRCAHSLLLELRASQFEKLY